MSGLSRSRSVAVLSVLAVVVPFGLTGGAAGETAARACVPVGAWVAPAGMKTLRAKELLAAAAKRAVVLLGETHDSAEDHRWQLHTIAALRALRPNLVLGFEAFPRRVQPALDRWVAGELTEAELLAQSDWRNVWGVDPQLYLPLFHFARMHRVPMVALNVEPSLAREVSHQGLDAIPLERREGVGRPAAPAEAYVDRLLPIYAEHARRDGKPANPDRSDPRFRRFVESQQLWDRAMAEALAAAAKRPGRPLVVGLMGSQHIVHGHGVPHQLHDLGVTDVATLVPWDRGADCKELVAGYADAVFGVAAPVAAADRRPRLGVYLEQAVDGVRIRRVEKGSIAEASGVREGDIVVEIAGRPTREAGDVAGAVQRQAPGTWLPLKVKRGLDTVELLAKFPPQPE
jgi:uncharacterized iron-regulated protein